MYVHLILKSKQMLNGGKLTMIKNQLFSFLLAIDQQYNIVN